MSSCPSLIRPLCLVLLLAGCGDDSSISSDASIDTDGAPACVDDSECDDGIFCNGSESCAAGSCTDGMPPCDDLCDEAGSRCGACAVPDADGDGEPSIACGGSDCDDDNPRRFPGNLEVCDVDDIDEDCDPSTFGRRDIDGDDVTDAACCNGSACGTDCDDNRAGINPTATEACNGLDDDCDGTVDEGVGTTYTIDADGDGFGAVDGETILACSPPDGYAVSATDCDDSAPAVNPGNDEVCDDAGVDENCDGLSNPPADCACSAGAPPRDCSLPGVCSDGVEMCIAGMWGACSIAPAAVDICDGRDEDCNGVADDPFMCARDSVRPCITGCGTTGTQTCDGTCRWTACTAPEVCNGCDDNGVGGIDDGFECALGGPATSCTNSCGNSGTATCGAGCMLDTCVGPEVCDYCDDDGDGTTDDELLDATTTDISIAPSSPDSCSDLLVSTGPADVFCSGGQLQYVDTGGSDEHAIGGWLATPLRVGYGPVVIDVDLFLFMSAGDDPGWGIGYVISGEPPSSLAGAAAFAAIPTDINGIAVEHSWSRDDPLFPRRDGLRIHQLRDGGRTTKLFDVDDELTFIPAVMRIDGPSGGAKRLIVRLIYDRGNSLTGTPRSLSMFVCEYESVDPAQCDPITEVFTYEGPGIPDLSPGDDLHFGVTVGTRGGGRAADIQPKLRWWHRQDLVSTNSCIL